MRVRVSESESGSGSVDGRSECVVEVLRMYRKG